MLKVNRVNMIDCDDWDNLVRKTYKKPYTFQQQEGCQERGTFDITIPSLVEDYENDTIPEEINGDEKGVSFSAWLARDIKEWNGNTNERKLVNLFWQRKFYPNIQVIANDLYVQGLIPAGDYTIKIDW